MLLNPFEQGVLGHWPELALAGAASPLHVTDKSKDLI
jgi:hypothetical protein